MNEDRIVVGKVKAGETLTQGKLDQMVRESGAIQFVPDSEGFSTPRLWSDHAMDALVYSLWLDRYAKPTKLTRWQRFRLWWSPRRVLARAFRNIAEWLEPQRGE